jgi:hypothetical protein
LYICGINYQNELMFAFRNIVFARKTGAFLPGIQRFSLLLLCICFSCMQLSAAGQAKEFYDATAITLGGDAQGFSVGKGENIRITAGETVRLLPGTWIQAGGEVVVEVRKESIPKESAENNSVLFHPELLTANLPIYCESHINTLPANEKQIGNSGGVHAVLPVPNNPNAKHLSAKKVLYHTCYNSAGHNGRSFHYQPTYSWGERPETIKVLLT